MTFPTLAEIKDANWDYLKTSAAAWRSLAHCWEAAFTEVLTPRRVPAAPRGPAPAPKLSSTAPPPMW